ncbi:hypothetical protein QUA71_09350 [Microcoleus sp. MON1_C5]|uniref:hypothetical protein n=1 Tax=Microcoleus sp. MON1_C5 TaxID=2818828 RepID=UPI002FD3F4FF
MKLDFLEPLNSGQFRGWRVLLELLLSIAPPILANLSQMMIFEQGGDRHSSSTTCQV